MNKLRSLTSGLTSSAPGTKLSKAFRFDKSHNVLTRMDTRKSGNPFLDGPTLEEPSLPKVHLILHLIAIFFVFLAICTMGAVAAFQAKWFAVTGGTGFTLFLLLSSFLISMMLVLVPMIYDRWDRLKRPAQFLRQTRSTLILHAFGTGLLLLAAFIVTISAWTAKGCKNVDEDPHESLGDDYKAGLKQWCTTKKASAVFDWLAFAPWLALLVLTAITFRKERRRDPSFIPPSNTMADQGISYSNILAQDDERYKVESKPDERPSLAGGAAGDRDDSAEYERAYSYTGYGAGGRGGEMGRPSVDAYGAFDDDMPGRGGYAQSVGGGVGGEPQPSRTMQMAYSDPYAQIRQSLLVNPGSEGYGLAQDGRGGYTSGALPHPPSYDGYR